jgi:hypothetical protein
MTSKEFFALTPRMFDALVKRHERATREREFMFGQLASIFINYSMARPKKPTKPTDFMPSEFAKEHAKRTRRPTKEERQRIDEQARDLIRALMKDQEQKK